MKTTDRPFAHAMAFYHQDGLPAAWKQAMKFAGKGGRLATMPDIVGSARNQTRCLALGDVLHDSHGRVLRLRDQGIPGP